MTSSVRLQFPSEDKDTKIPEAPYNTRMFLKGQPAALGTVQILIGIVMIAVGAVTWYTQTMIGEIPLGLGLSFILSGSLSLGAHKGTSSPTIKSAAALNIISALLAISGICYFCFALATNRTRSCESSDYYVCEYVVDRLQRLLYGIKGMLLVLSTLELCLCMTTVVFSCKTNAHTSGTKMEEVLVNKWETGSSA